MKSKFEKSRIWLRSGAIFEFRLRFMPSRKFSTWDRNAYVFTHIAESKKSSQKIIFLDLIRNAKRVETLFTAMGILSSVHRINASYHTEVLELRTSLYSEVRN